ncbi:g8348 [Coccomyxa elongata]
MTLVAHGKVLDLKDYTVSACKEGASWLRDYITAIKSGQYHPFTKLERKAREATRNEPWGPTGMILNDLAESSHNYNDCLVIFAVIQLRLGYPPAKWRNVYKALTVLEFLVKRGSERCVSMARSELTPRLEDLEGFQYVSPEGRDQGINVRHRAQAIGALLKDTQRLREEREAFAKKRRTYAGYSRDEMTPARSASTGLDVIDGGTSSLRRSRSENGESSFPAYGHDATSPGEATPQSTLRSATRGAGEMKGVTMEENKKQLAALRKLLEQPGNRTCADCTGGGAAGRATWASINTGVFICMRCAGHHRGLGVHISKVRSCTLDTWLPEQVAFMARTGNAKANVYYEAKLEPSQKPSYNSPDLEAFIRRKYNGAFAEGTWPPPETLEAATPPSAEKTRSTAADPPTVASSSAAVAKQLVPNSNGSFWASRPAASQSPDEDHSFGESAFAAPPTTSGAVPDLMDFDWDPPAPAPASSSQQVQPTHMAGAPQQAGGPAGLGGFAELMAGSSQPSIMDSDPFAASQLHSSQAASLQAHPSQPPTSQPGGLEPGVPRSLTGAFDAASAPTSALQVENPFGAPPAFPAPVAASAGANGAARDLSFDSEPAPNWDMPAGGAAPPVAAAAAFPPSPPVSPSSAAPPANAGMVSVPLPAASAAAVPSLKLVPAARQLGPTAALVAAGRQLSAQKAKGSAKVGDPTGFVLEDLLAHAVENLRLKNAAKTSLAGRPPTQAPSLLEQKVARHIDPAGR